MRALWFHVMHLLYLRVKSIKGKIFKNNLPPAPERRGALSPLLSEMFCGVVMAFSAGEGAGNLFGGLVVGDGGSITASSASSAPRASSADRNQEQLPRLRRGECSRRALLSQWCLVCASNGPWCARGEQGWRAHWVCPAVAELSAVLRECSQGCCGTSSGPLTLGTNEYQLSVSVQ